MQLNCLGKLIPLLDPSQVSLANYVETYSLIHLAYMTNSTLTVTNSIFTDNISLNGVI
jgi:hypothetical protein